MLVMELLLDKITGSLKTLGEHLGETTDSFGLHTQPHLQLTQASVV